MGAKGYVGFVKEFYKREILSVIEYRFNFIAQTVGMFLNDAFWLLFWFLLFQRFETIQGWRFQEMMLLNSILQLSWGGSSLLFGNWRSLPKMIYEGQLDYYLSFPKNVLLHTLMRVRYSGMGDFLFGIMLAVLVVPLEKFPLFILLVVSASLIILAWDVLVSSITFYVGFFEGATKTATDALLTLSFYPFSVYSGATKFILLFIIPAGFVTGIPVELLKNFSWKWFGITLSFSILFSAFAVWFFYRGLKKYESGNIIAMHG